MRGLVDLSVINQCLSRGEIDDLNIFQYVKKLSRSPYRFEIDFGLKTLPKAPGILLIRGPRQYGKSTWLEGEILKTIQDFGAGSAYYLNGDHLLEPGRLEEAILALLPAFGENVGVKRLFIDEITAVDRWEGVLKKLVDSGQLADILVVTSGSKATDLRRGSERLPGRKGRLAKTDYFFTPLSYSTFHKHCHEKLKSRTVLTYLLSGGSPLACQELVENGNIPEYLVSLTRDWIDGEIAASGRTRSAVFNIFQAIFRFGGTPVGQAKLARETGLANNTTAQNYIEILSDLGCVGSCYPWDPDKKISILRKPCKFQILNLLAAIAYHPANIRSVEDFLRLSCQEQGLWYEWLVAQELNRQNALLYNKILEPLNFWQSREHEIDFVNNGSEFIEVKRGKSSRLNFAWFEKSFPKQTLTIINEDQFKTRSLHGILLEDFLFRVS